MNTHTDDALFEYSLKPHFRNDNSSSSLHPIFMASFIILFALNPNFSSPSGFGLITCSFLFR